MTPDKPKRGGARPNSGPKKGSGKGRIHVTFSGSMHPDELAHLRELQQGQPLGKWLVKRLKLKRNTEPSGQRSASA